MTHAHQWRDSPNQLGSRDRNPHRSHGAPGRSATVIARSVAGHQTRGALQDACYLSTTLAAIADIMQSGQDTVNQQGRFVFPLGRQIEDRHRTHQLALQRAQEVAAPRVQ